MEFKLSYYSKYILGKKKKYEFYFTKEDIDEGMKRNFDNPHYCKQNGNKINKRVFKAEETKGPMVNVALYDNHYFTFEETKYTKYSIINLEKVKKYEDFHKISKLTKN